MLFTLLFAGVVAADTNVSTDAVTVEFQGRSGGFKLFPNNEDRFFQIASDSLTEYSSTSKQGKQASVSGGKFVQRNATESDDGKTVYHYTYSKLGNKKNPYNFTMSCMFSQESTSVFDPVVNQTVNVTANTLKFSVAINGWSFASEDNTLEYDISIKDKTGEKISNATDAKKTTFSMNDGSIETPLTAVVDGIPQDIEVISSEKGSKNIITFKFPYFAKSLKYDPDVTLTLSPTTESPNPSSASTTVLSLAAVAMALLA